MIARFIGVLSGICCAYVLAIFLAPYLPTIAVKGKSEDPLTFQQVLTKYLIRDSDERLHILASPRPANWESPLEAFNLYDLANAVPSEDPVYTQSGATVEALYETLLLSLRPGENRELRRLQNRYLAARNDVASRAIRKDTRDKRIRAQQEALTELLNYIESNGVQATGPAPLALGKALRDFYGATSPKVRIPGSEERNFRVVLPSPPLGGVIDGSTPIPSINLLVPIDQVVDVGLKDLPVRAQQLRIAELSLTRPWLDSTMLARTKGPWNGDDPGLFGPGGKFLRIPIRLALIERPVITASAATVESSESGETFSVGPLTYAKSEVSSDGKLLTFKPSVSQWIIVGVVTKAL